MSLPTGAISMNDISLAYGRGAAGYSGFQNYYPYALGEYYRGGIYVPWYLPAGSGGDQPQSQSNVSMGALRGTGGFTHYSLITAATSAGKFPSVGYASFNDGNYGSVIGESNGSSPGFKCYGQPLASIYYIGLLQQVHLRIYGTLQNAGWHELRIGNSVGVPFLFLLRSAATVSSATSASGTFTVTQWSWGGFTSVPFTIGTQYTIAVRLTNNY